MDRRHFLKTALASGLGYGSLSLLNRQVQAAAANSNKKMLFIFQRGGNDGLNTVIPRGDTQYNEANRPSIFIPESEAHDLGNGFAQLNPRMTPMMELFHSQALTGTEGPGNLAVIHRVGYANQSRSHFDSQDYWESGAPRNSAVSDGMLYRHILETTDPKESGNALLAASLSSSQQRAFSGEHPFPNFSSVDSFDVRGDDDERRKFLGQEASSLDAEDGEGLLGLYSGTGVLSTRHTSIVRSTGRSLGSSIQSLQSIQGDYTPDNGAIYPDDVFGDKLRDAAKLFKRTSARFLGINLGGWDTHSNQGSSNGEHGNNLGDLAQGFQALYRDLQSQWEDLIIVTMTEFGRTSKENGSGGTDHAEASAMFVAGGGVNGGVYNCDSKSWADGDMFSQRGRYVARKTDFRTVFGEIFRGHFGNSPESMDTIFPGFSEAQTENPTDFEPLGLFG